MHKIGSEERKVLSSQIMKNSKRKTLAMFAKEDEKDEQISLIVEIARGFEPGNILDLFLKAFAIR